MEVVRTRSRILRSILLLQVLLAGSACQSMQSASCINNLIQNDSNQASESCVVGGVSFNSSDGKNSSENQKMLYEVNRVEIDKPCAESIGVEIESDGGSAAVNKDIFNLWNNFPMLFVPTKRAGKECLRESQTFLAALRKMDIWALKMFDATAKFPSGILSGNVNQYGDYDECLSIRGEAAPVKGQYCLATLDISMRKQGFSAAVDSMLHSHYWLASNITDLGHRVPRVSSIYWGICLPSSCTAEDLQNTLEDSLGILKPLVSVEQKLCVTHQEDVPYSTGKKITLVFFATLVGCMLIGTIFYSDSVKNKDNEAGTVQRILSGFSLKRNFKKLTDTSLKEEVRGIDGIRALNAFALLMTHKSFALFFNPYVNRTAMAETFSLPWAVIGRTAIIYTDSFLLVSGFLTARGLTKDLQRSGDMKFTKKLITRFFRIVPTLLCIILFCTFILPDLGSGPLWEMVVTDHARLCKKNMWKNFLFIHNFMGFEKMCLTHTHQLGIDMQLFLVTPLAVGLLGRNARRGGFILLGIAALSTVLRYAAVMIHEISMVIYFGMPVRKFFDSSNFSYILPTHRATIYLMGVGLSYFMSQKRSQIYLTKFQAFVGWTITGTLGALAMFGPMHMGQLEYKYDVTEAAIYSAVSPIIWGTFISWAIWASSNNCAGWLGDILSWRGFRIFTKIAYGVYLTQFPTFFYNIGIQKYAGYYGSHMMFNIPEVAFIILTSVVLALVIEMPFNNICKILTETRTPKRTSEINDEALAIGNHNHHETKNNQTIL